MISRIWFGWTTQQNADAYEKLLALSLEAESSRPELSEAKAFLAN